MKIVYRRVDLSGILSKLDHFLSLTENFFTIPGQNPRTLATALSKVFLSLSFQETKASSTISC